jgi:hypothetical protein
MRLSTTTSYTRIVGSGLFFFGIIGFAFKTSFNIADHYLLASLLLGFWGILTAVHDRAK